MKNFKSLVRSVSPFVGSSKRDKRSSTSALSYQEFNWDLKDVDLHNALTEFYTINCPSKISTVAHTLEQFDGDYITMLRQLCERHETSEKAMNEFLLVGRSFRRRSMSQALTSGASDHSSMSSSQLASTVMKSSRRSEPTVTYSHLDEKKSFASPIPQIPEGSNSSNRRKSKAGGVKFNDVLEYAKDPRDSESFSESDIQATSAKPRPASSLAMKHAHPTTTNDSTRSTSIPRSPSEPPPPPPPVHAVSTIETVSVAANATAKRSSFQSILSTMGSKSSYSTGTTLHATDKGGKSNKQEAVSSTGSISSSTTIPSTAAAGSANASAQPGVSSTVAEADNVHRPQVERSGSVDKVDDVLATTEHSPGVVDAEISLPVSTSAGDGDICTASTGDATPGQDRRFTSSSTSSHQTAKSQHQGGHGDGSSSTGSRIRASFSSEPKSYDQLKAQLSKALFNEGKPLRPEGAPSTSVHADDDVPGAYSNPLPAMSVSSVRSVASNPSPDVGAASVSSRGDLPLTTSSTVNSTSRRSVSKQSMDSPSTNASSRKRLSKRAVPEVDPHAADKAAAQIELLKLDNAKLTETITGLTGQVSRTDKEKEFLTKEKERLTYSLEKIQKTVSAYESQLSTCEAQNATLLSEKTDVQRLLVGLYGACGADVDTVRVEIGLYVNKIDPKIKSKYVSHWRKLVDQRKEEAIVSRVEHVYNSMPAASGSVDVSDLLIPPKHNTAAEGSKSALQLPSSSNKQISVANNKPPSIISGLSTESDTCVEYPVDDDGDVDGNRAYTQPTNQSPRTSKQTRGPFHPNESEMLRLQNLQRIPGQSQWKSSVSQNASISSGSSAGSRNSSPYMKGTKSSSARLSDTADRIQTSGPIKLHSCAASADSSHSERKLSRQLEGPCVTDRNGGSSRASSRNASPSPASVSAATYTTSVTNNMAHTPSHSEDSINDHYNLAKEYYKHGVEQSNIVKQMSRSALLSVEKNVMQAKLSAIVRDTTPTGASGVKLMEVDDWMECFDAKSGKPYYYSKSRKQSTWSRPACIPRVNPIRQPFPADALAVNTNELNSVDSSAMNDVSSVGSVVATPNPNPATPSPLPTTSSSSSAKAKHFPSSSSSKTHRAASPSPIPSSSGRHTYSPTSRSTPTASASAASSSTHASAASGSAVKAKASHFNSNRLPKSDAVAWQKAFDPSSGRDYWFNRTTRESRWTNPNS